MLFFCLFYTFQIIFNLTLSVPTHVAVDHMIFLSVDGGVLAIDPAIDVFHVGY